MSIAGRLFEPEHVLTNSSVKNDSSIQAKIRGVTSYKEVAQPSYQESFEVFLFCGRDDGAPIVVHLADQQNHSV